MRPLLSVVAALGLASPLLAAPLRVTNARVETRSAASGLAPVVKAELSARSGPAWIGWTVPTTAKESSCCWSSDDAVGGSCRGCRLEGKGGFVTTSDDPVKLEGSDRLRVLLRVEAGRVSRIRTFSEDCPIDAGGLPLVWLEDVRPAESVAFVATFVGQPRDDAKGKRLDDSALAAIAFHADPKAVDTIIEVAKRDPDAHVRGQALFWLSQTAARRAPEAIRAALDDDPEVEVKKKAVFALSQLPKDEGVPLLIGVARTHQSYEVRKQAMFWLGQSQDPRVLAFFEDVLKR